MNQILKLAEFAKQPNHRFKQRVIKGINLIRKIFAAIIRMNQNQEFLNDQQDFSQLYSQNFSQMKNEQQHQQQYYLNYTQQNDFYRQLLQPQPSIIYYTYPIQYNSIQFCTNHVYANQQIGYHQYNICNDSQLNQQKCIDDVDSQNKMKIPIQKQNDSRYNFSIQSTQNEYIARGIKIDDQNIKKKQIFQITQRQDEVSSKEVNQDEKIKNEDDEKQIEISNFHLKKENNSYYFQRNPQAKSNDSSKLDLKYQDKEYFVNHIFDSINHSYNTDVIKHTNNSIQQQKQKKHKLKQQYVKNDEQILIKNNLKQEFAQEKQDISKEEKHQNSINNGYINYPELMNKKQVIISSKQASVENKQSKSEKVEQENQQIQKMQSNFFAQKDGQDQQNINQIISQTFQNSQSIKIQQKQGSPSLQQGVKSQFKQTKKQYEYSKRRV
ncbi:hypothetical protein ABPG72_005480 [Tetrahymena utriculariae]